MDTNTLLAVTLAGDDLLRLLAVPIAIAAVGALVTTVITRVSATADRRRARYAEAVETLAAWIEFPYRVRRRTNDDPETLGELAALGHQLQERLACHQAWISSERKAAATAYESARETIGTHVGEALVEAWAMPPVSGPAEMVLGDWGPGPACSPALTQVQKAIAIRFQWWRIGARPER